MSETLTVPKDTVIKAYNNAKTTKRKAFLETIFGKEIFIPNVMERIKTFEDACKELGLPVPKFMEPKNNDDRAVIAFQKLTIIIRALNEGWRPNWGNFDQNKYYAWFKFEKGSDESSGFGFSCFDWTNSDSDVGSRLCFHSKELAIYAGNQFTDLYKDYLTL